MCEFDSETSQRDSSTAASAKEGSCMMAEMTSAHWSRKGLFNLAYLQRKQERVSLIYGVKIVLKLHWWKVNN